MRSFRVPFAVVTSLFFLWGFITVLVDGLIPRLKETFELTYAQSGFVQVAWFLAYFVVSIPAGFLISRIGYKRGIFVGLAIAGLGCMLFYPAAETRVYLLFLMALFILAGGITILQVAANPYVTALGPPQRAASRLNLAQAFNSIGTTIAPIFGAAFLLSDKILAGVEIESLNDNEKLIYYNAEASAVEGPFLILGSVLVFLGLIVAFIKLPKLVAEESRRGFAKAFKRKPVYLGAIAIFLYVGAEVAIGSYLTNYFMEMGLVDVIRNSPTLGGIAGFISETFNGKSLSAIDGKAVVGTFVMFYWGSAMVGRFIGSYLTTKVKPGTVLTGAAIGAITMAIVTIFSSGILAMWSALLIGLFNATMFPTIFSMAANGAGKYRTQASGILCTCIAGGALIPITYASIADTTSLSDDAATRFKIAMLVPILCYVFIAFYSKWIKSNPPTASVEVPDDFNSDSA